MKNSIKSKEELKREAEAIQRIEAYHQTKGFKKMWNYYLAITDSDSFRLFISDVRYKCGIPQIGFKDYEEKKRWREHCSSRGFDCYKELQKDLNKFCKKYKLHYVDWYEIIEEYIYYNKKGHPIHSNSYNLCLISDLAEEKKEPFSKDFQESDNLAYPIAVRISPYASLRDILDYIKRLYKVEIKPLQDSYKSEGIKIGKIKTKNLNVQQRNSFIYENKDLPRKKIKELVQKKFNITLDYEYIGKIISEEKKRRKKL